MLVAAAVYMEVKRRVRVSYDAPCKKNCNDDEENTDSGSTKMKSKKARKAKKGRKRTTTESPDDDEDAVAEKVKSNFCYSNACENEF